MLYETEKSTEGTCVTKSNLLIFDLFYDYEIFVDVGEFVGFWVAQSAKKWLFSCQFEDFLYEEMFKMKILWKILLPRTYLFDFEECRVQHRIRSDHITIRHQNINNNKLLIIKSGFIIITFSILVLIGHRNNFKHLRLSKLLLQF